MILTNRSEILNNQLHIGGVALSTLAKEFGTPLYVYDQVDIEYRINNYKEAFSSKQIKTNIAYASKAILTSYVAKIMQKHDLSIDAISIGDMYILKKSGFDLSKVYLHGNSKSNQELSYAIENGIGIIVVDNLEEVDAIKELAYKFNKGVRFMARINPDIYAKTHNHLITAEKNSKFGIAKESKELKEKLITLKDEKLISFQGFHCHIGSQVNNTETFLIEVESMLELAEEFENELGINVNELNFGGGYAIKQRQHESEPPVNDLLRRIVDLVETRKHEYGLSLKKITIEPGRSIIGPAGVTLYKVEATKRTAGDVNYVMVDGGMADNIRPSLYQAIYEAAIVDNAISKSNTITTIAGKCCESGDILIKDIELPNVRVGDYLAVFATGAYNYSMASNYNGLVKPAIVFVKDGKYVLTTKREEVEQIHQNDLETNII
jgi:diaminopimelate decarboxylase